MAPPNPQRLLPRGCSPSRSPCWECSRDRPASSYRRPLRPRAGPAGSWGTERGVTSHRQRSSPGSGCRQRERPGPARRLPLTAPHRPRRCRRRCRTARAGGALEPAAGAQGGLRAAPQMWRAAACVCIVPAAPAALRAEPRAGQSHGAGKRWERGGDDWVYSSSRKTVLSIPTPSPPAVIWAS